MAEVELKLELDPAERARVPHAAALAAVKPKRKRMASVYLDTADCALAGAGMALRLRREGGRWVQCLKAGHSGTGGLHARDEWEFERPDRSIDLSLFADTPLAKLEGAADLHSNLVAAFDVDFVRTTWLLAPAEGTRLEVALDAGAVESRGRREEISELEIECIEGDPARAFDLASALLDEVALRPSATTKAARGYRLFRGQALRPVKASPAKLPGDLTPAGAARALVASALDQLQANEAGLLRSPAPEFVHQARVALRRMRSAFRMFRDAIGEERARAWLDEWASLAHALGDARDWDVFGTETLPALAAAHGDAAVSRALVRRVLAHRRRSREAARDAIRSPRHARAVLELTRWLARIGGEDDASSAEPLVELASRRIRKHHKRLVAGIERLPSMSAEERHRVRIEAKRQRYGVEGLAAIFPGRRERRYAKRLSALQDALGRANDAVTGARLLAAIEPPGDFAAFARGWFAARSEPDPALLATLASRLAGSPRFWRKASAQPASD
ncbi:MAG: CYTH and CHAD domain-containing protein [Usitatibacter sp.]